MGINLKKQGRLDEALHLYKKALELDPGNSVILYNLGTLFNIRSEYELAVKSLIASINAD
jgi:Flp pilus assembly protein TadD